MNLSGFDFSEDTIGLESQGKYFDLHNCFDFEGIEYDVNARRLVLNWKKGIEEWVEKGLPQKINLEFRGVSLFKARQRDPATPFTEDNCVDTMSFIHKDLIEEMNGIFTNKPNDEFSHLLICFVSGLAFKIVAEEAHLRIE